MNQAAIAAFSQAERFSPLSRLLLQLLLSAPGPAGAKYPELQSYLELRREFLGARAILILLRQPGRPLSAARLNQMLNRRYRAFRERIEPLEAPSPNHFIFEYPIPLCDARALREVKLRRVQIQNRLREEGLPETIISTLKEELKALDRYLRDCLSPQGRIRSFNSIPRRHYIRLKTAINRFLRRCQQEEPALARLIRDHLQTGERLLWKE